VNHPGNCLLVGDILLRLIVSGLRFRKQARGLRDHNSAVPSFFLFFRFSGLLFSNAVGRELRCRKFSLYPQLSQYAVSFLGVAPRLGLWSPASAMGAVPRKCGVRWSRPCTALIPLHPARDGATALYCSVLEVGSNQSDGHDLGWRCDVLAATSQEGRQGPVFH
jgi:hypothetical protein